MFRWIFGKPVARDEVEAYEKRTGVSDPNAYDSHFDFGLSDRSIREREERQAQFDRDERARHENEERSRRQLEEQNRQ